jgi:hypothetical protein
LKIFLPLYSKTGTLMLVKVELLGCGEKEKGKFREVTVHEADLNEIFYWGQNDFQPLNCRSVSMGDIIYLNNKRFVICAIGFKEINDSEYEEYCNTPPRDRMFLPMVDNLQSNKDDNA